MSVTNNSLSKDYPHPDDNARQTTDTPGFKPFTKYIYHSYMYIVYRWIIQKNETCLEGIHIKNKPVLFKQYLPTINLKIIHCYNFQNSGFNFGIFFSFLWLMKLGDCSDTSDECFYFCIGHCTCMWAAFICEAVLSITQYSALTCYRCTCTLCDTAVFLCGKNIYTDRVQSVP